MESADCVSLLGVGELIPGVFDTISEDSTELDKLDGSTPVTEADTPLVAARTSLVNEVTEEREPSSELDPCTLAVELGKLTAADEDVEPSREDPLRAASIAGPETLTVPLMDANN